MIKVVEKLFIGSEADCRIGDDDWAIVHACKSPCHQRAVGYRGSLPRSHPNYLVLEEDSDLYLNIIDPPGPLFMPTIFTSFLEFAQRHWEQGRKILIHCNQGESRAPSLGMLFLAKCRNEISSESFDSAKQEFQRIYPYYQPGQGIQTYLREKWNDF
ncbi:MAG TPA: hypothetical protein ENH85_05760 [Candidatus Scalindua sp.]|nr:hypothetical protein [Candidatus Scalindua sp.]